MHIALIVDDYLPSAKSAALMMHQLAAGIAAAGHEATLMTPSASVPGLLDASRTDGFTLLRFRSGRVKNVNKPLRCVNESLLSLRLLHAAKKHDFGRVDLIAFYSPSIFWGPAVKALKRRFGCGAFLILRDIFPKWVVDQKMLSPLSPIYAYFKLFERISYSAADAIGVQAAPDFKYLETQNCSHASLSVFPNWCQPETLRPKHASGAWRQRLGLGGKTIFFFGGNLGKAQDMDNIVRLTANLKSSPEAHFLLVGKGDEYESIASKKAKLALDNITLLPAVQPEEYFDMLAEADVGIFSLHPSRRGQDMPGKILGYLSCGKPVLGSANPENNVKELLNSSRVGLTTWNPDDEGFAANARRLLNPALRAELGRNALELLNRRFSVNAAVNKLLQTAAKMQAAKATTEPQRAS